MNTWFDKHKWWLTANLGLLLVVVYSAHAAPQTPKVVRAEKFELTDAAGNVRAAIDMDNKSPRLIMYAADGSERAHLVCNDDFSALLLYGVGGKQVGGLEATKDAAELYLKHDDKLRVRVRTTAGGTVLSLLNAKEQPMESLLATDEGTASIETRDESNKNRILLGYIGAKPQMIFADKDQKTTMILGQQTLPAMKTGQFYDYPAAMAIFDQPGNILWRSP